MSEKLNSLAYNSVWQLRADAWSRLEEAGLRLSTLLTQGRPTTQVCEQVSELLELLRPIERYWAFPGRGGFEQMARLFAAADYDRFARTIAGINRALVTDSYRSGIAWSPQTALSDLTAQDGGGEKPVSSRPPYFEVLVLEEMTAAQEQALKDEMRRLRPPAIGYKRGPGPLG